MGKRVALVTTKQAAERLNKSVPTITRWAISGKLKPAVKVGGLTGSYLFRESDVAALERQEASEPISA